MNKGFPPTLRLRSKADFKALRGGRRLRIDGLCFVYCRSEFPHARLGLAVSRKYGNAVQRNRLKRRLREAFRQHEIRSLPLDILVYPTTDVSSDLNMQKIIKGMDRIVKNESGPS